MKNEDPLKMRLIQYSVSVMRLAHEHAADRVLGPVFNQVIRSTCSIGANLTEAHGANTKAGFKNYFHIALQSARETRYWLEVLSAYGIKEQTAIEGLIRESDEYIRIIVASLKTMKNRS
jgi:four helix bundle protein